VSTRGGGIDSVGEGGGETVGRYWTGHGAYKSMVKGSTILNWVCLRGGTRGIE
jgi:hypothetical protein